MIEAAQSEYSADKIFLYATVWGAMLAFTFNVGYFWAIGINFFSFFSLAEHIVLAIQVIPIAIAIVILSLVIGALSSLLFVKRKRISEVAEDLLAGRGNRLDIRPSVGAFVYLWLIGTAIWQLLTSEYEYISSSR